MRIIFIIVVCAFCASLSAQEFDPTNPDYELLKQMVIEKINAKRARKTNNYLKNNEALQLTSDNYTRSLRATKFESNTKNKTRINKKIKKTCKYNGYTNAFIDYHITSLECMKFKGKKFYFDKEDKETNTHLFIGKKPTKKEREDEKFKANPMKLFTYDELADLIAKQFVSDEGIFRILNNGFDKFGFSLAVEQRTLFRTKIPKIKSIIILGGNRITW